MSSIRGTAFQAAVSIPSCDAWGNIQIGTANANEPTVLLDGRGIQSVARLSTNNHQLNMSEPQRYGGGGHIFLTTPEFDGITVGVVGFNRQWFTSPFQSGVATAEGNTAASVFTFFKPEYPVIQGGHTLSSNSEFPYGKAYMNVAAFCFAVDDNIRTPVVANGLSDGEDFFSWGGLNLRWEPVSNDKDALPQELRHIVPGVTVSKFTPDSGKTSGNANISKTNIGGTKLYPGKYYTYSAYVKGADIQSPQVYLYYRDGTANQYAQTDFKLDTKSMTIASGATWSGLCASYRDVGDGWYRIWLSGKWNGPLTTNGRLDAFFYAGSTSAAFTDGTKGLYATAFQIEEGRYPTPYIRNKNYTTGYGITGDQSVRLSFNPGAAGYGTSEPQYQSTWSATNYQRSAVAYGTIVIPAGSVPVSAYIENGFNVSGVSAGSTSSFDVSFTVPMNNTNYCVILSNEVEAALPSSGSDYGNLSEYSLLAIDRSQKTTGRFRVFSLKQNYSNNSFTQQNAASENRVERINFMVFGERSGIQNGSAWLSNPTSSQLSAPVNSLDYEVWSSNWIAPIENTGKTSAVPLFRPYASVGFNGNFHPEKGITTYAETSAGGISAWVTQLQAIPKGRRCFYPLFYANVIPVNISTGNNTERLVQHYAALDGYTYTSTVHPSGITTAGFTYLSSGSVPAGGMTYDGATFAASRRVLGLFADRQTADVQESLNYFVSRLDSAGVQMDYITDDAENIGDYLGYNLNGGLSKYSRNHGSGVNIQGRPAYFDQFGYGGAAGNTLYWDDYGISAGNTLARINNYYPEQWRAIANDPRVTTYKFSLNGITNDSSPTVASRFMELYREILTAYNVPGITATSYTGAVELLYGRGSRVSTTWGGSSGKTFAPYWATDETAYQPNSVDHFGRFAIAVAHNTVAYELYHGHYRSIAFKPLLDRGMTYTQYRSGAVHVEDMIYASDANSFPYPDASHSNSRAMYSPSFYGSAAGDYLNGSHLINKAGYYPNPVNSAQRYLYSGYTYPQATGSGLIPNGCKWFYPRTSLLGPSGAHFGLTGATTGTMMGSTMGGNTLSDALPSGITGVSAWGGYTAFAGDLLWFSGVTTPYTVAAGATAKPGEKKRIPILDPLLTNISAGTLFEIERPRSNQAYLNFIHELRHVRAIIRANPRIERDGFCPWISEPTLGKSSSDKVFSYWMDERYWWEHMYHLIVSGTQFFNFWSGGGTSPIDGRADANAIAVHTALTNWRNISGNGRTKCVTTDNINLSDPVQVSGGLLISGTNKGLYIWRITIRPGPFNETVNLVQTARNDIPERLVITGGQFTDHPDTATTKTATRGIWLLTRSSVVPQYRIE